MRKIQCNKKFPKINGLNKLIGYKYIDQKNQFYFYILACRKKFGVN